MPERGTRATVIGGLNEQIRNLKDRIGAMDTAPNGGAILAITNTLGEIVTIHGQLLALIIEGDRELEREIENRRERSAGEDW